MTNGQHPEFSESEAALIERRADQGVSNTFMGAAAIEGSYPTNEDHPTTTRRVPRQARRTTRPQPAETTGEAVSRDIANQFALENPIDHDGQREINRRGRAKLAAFLKQNELDVKLRHIHERDEMEDPDYADRTQRESDLATNAILRTTFDRRKP